MLVSRAKAYAFGAKLFQAIGQDPSTEPDIRKLLKKLSGQKLPEFTVPCMVDLEPLFDWTFHSIAINKKIIDLIRQKAEISTTEWDLSVASH